MKGFEWHQDSLGKGRASDVYLSGNALLWNDALQIKQRKNRLCAVLALGLSKIWGSQKRKIKSMRQ